jgi:membrane-bound lytic murein transglycosylase B
VPAAFAGGSGTRMLVISAALISVVCTAALAGVLAAVLEQVACSPSRVKAAASSRAEHDIPARYLQLYRVAGRDYGVPWPVLAGIGAIETDHGRSDAPGVRSGVNRHGCCAGPMQFNLSDGPLSTWERYAVDGNHDGRSDVYGPEDAIPSAANYLHALLEAANAACARRSWVTTTPPPTSAPCSHARAPTRARPSTS